MNIHNTVSSDAAPGKPYAVAVNAQIPPALPIEVLPLAPTVTDSASHRKQICPIHDRALQENSVSSETGLATIDTSIQAATTHDRPSKRTRAYSINCHYDLDIIFCWIVLLLSCGTPYWYYRWIRGSLMVEDSLPDMPSTNSGSETHLHSSLLGERKMQQLTRFWKSHQIIVGVIIAPLFPLISVSPLPKCSWAYIFGALTLLHAIMTFSISVLYKEHFELPKLYTGEDLIGNFFNKHKFQLWVFLSLPSAWFTGFLICFTISLLMIAFGMDTQENCLHVGLPSISTGCDMAHIRFIRASVVLTLVSIVSSLLYIKSKVGKLFCHSGVKNGQHT